jgi:hypothetical protein
VKVSVEDAIFNLRDVDTCQDYVYAIQKVADQVMGQWPLGLKALLSKSYGSGFNRSYPNGKETGSLDLLEQNNWLVRWHLNADAYNFNRNQHVGYLKESINEDG